jgi:precorrin-2 dehydrogenase/sirohydrochlorin ferrochelatase
VTKKYPIFLNLKNRNLLIVGGGLACLEKLQGLDNTEANITIIARDLHPEVVRFLESRSSIITIVRDANPEDLKNRDIIFLATNDPEINRYYREIAHKLKTWANSVDDPDNCDFYSASLINLGAVSFSISTDGQFAGLTATLRKLFEEVIPEGDADLFQKLYEMRKSLKAILPDHTERRKALKEIVKNLESKYFKKSDP